MRRVISLIPLLFYCIQLNAQKSVNLIISIDDAIVTGSLSGLKLVAIATDGSKKAINADYYPGNLSLSNDDYRRLLDTGVRTVYITFNYTENHNQRQQLYNYEIDLNKGWLGHYYYILRIYNTTKKKYRKIFTTPEGREYVYEFDYPGGSTNLIRKRSLK